MKSSISSVLTLIVIVAQVISSPVPHSKHSKSDNKERILYDQRQEGEWNIRADLNNFVILIIPKTLESQEETSSSSLFDLLTRSHPKHHGKHVKNAHKHNSKIDNNEVGAETMHFIESKTAPYHVDITKSDSHLMNDEILATQTPPVALSLKTTDDKAKDEPIEDVTKAALLRQLRSTKFAKAFVLTVPEEDFVLTKMEEDKKVVKKDGIKKVISKVKNKEEMTLLGADEQCGPDMTRDAEGVCRLTKLAHTVESNESTNRDE